MACKFSANFIYNAVSGHGEALLAETLGEAIAFADRGKLGTSGALKGKRSYCLEIYEGPKLVYQDYSHAPGLVPAPYLTGPL